MELVSPSIYILNCTGILEISKKTHYIHLHKG